MHGSLPPGSVGPEHAVPHENCTQVVQATLPLLAINFLFHEHSSPCCPQGPNPEPGPTGFPAHPALLREPRLRKETETHGRECQELELRSGEGHAELGDRGRGELSSRDEGPSQGSGQGQLEQRLAGDWKGAFEWTVGDDLSQVAKSTWNLRPTRSAGPCTEDGFCLREQAESLMWQEGPPDDLGSGGSGSPLLALPHSHLGP